MTRLTLADDDLFGLHDLPYGVYSVPGQEPRIAVRYGGHVVDVSLLLGGDNTFGRSMLNTFMAQGRERWIEVRAAITVALGADVPESAVNPVDAVTLHLPFEVADDVDFYASEHHASNLGRLFRSDSPDPLTPNWKRTSAAPSSSSLGVVSSRSTSAESSVRSSRTATRSASRPPLRQPEVDASP